MYPRHARHPAKEPDLDLVASRLHFQMFGGTNLGEHRRFLPLDAPILPLEFLAPLARRIGRAIRPLLRLDALAWLGGRGQGAGSGLPFGHDLQPWRLDSKQTMLH